MKPLSLHLLTVAVCFSTVVFAQDAKVGARVPSLTQNKTTISTKDLKIGTVDLYGAMSSCEDGKEKQTVMQGLQTTEATKLEEKRQKSAKKVEEFNAKKDALSKEAREKEEQELMALSRELQQEVQKAQEYVRGEINKATEELAKAAETAAIEIAKGEGLDLLMETNTGRVVYKKESFDVTGKVQKKMNDNYKVKVANQTKAAAPATTKVASATPAKKAPASTASKKA